MASKVPSFPNSIHSHPTAPDVAALVRVWLPEPPPHGGYERLIEQACSRARERVDAADQRLTAAATTEPRRHAAILTEHL